LYFTFDCNRQHHCCYLCRGATSRKCRGWTEQERSFFSSLAGGDESRGVERNIGLSGSTGDDEYSWYDWIYINVSTVFM